LLKKSYKAVRNNYLIYFHLSVKVAEFYGALAPEPKFVNHYNLFSRTISLSSAQLLNAEIGGVYITVDLQAILFLSF